MFLMSLNINWNRIQMEMEMEISMKNQAALTGEIEPDVSLAELMYYFRLKLFERALK